MIDETWSGSAIRYNRPHQGRPRPAEHWTFDLSRPVDEVRRNLSTLPLNPPSSLRSMDAFEDSLSQGLRDTTASVELIFERWPQLSNTDRQFWKSLAWALHSAVDGAMVWWDTEDFPPNAEPLPGVSVLLLRGESSVDSYVPAPETVASIAYWRESNLDTTHGDGQSIFFLDLTGCESMRDASLRLARCGLISRRSDVDGLPELGNALRQEMLDRNSASNILVKWAGRVGSDRPAYGKQMHVEVRVARLFADVVRRAEEQAANGTQSPMITIDIDAPMFRRI